ncbi:MAG: class I SAM-dependent methyltransferase [Elusimicrobiota bacterium]
MAEHKAFDAKTLGPSLKEQVSKANELYFDVMATKYDHDPRQKMGYFHPNTRERYRRFIRINLGVIKDGGVLNLGCGSGFAMDVEAEFGLDSTGIDISAGMLEEARRKGVKARLIKADAYKIPLPDASVGLVSCFVFLHHIYDHEALFKEIARVLKPGGLLYTDYDPNFYCVDRIKKNWLLGKLWERWENASEDVRQTEEHFPLEVFHLADYHDKMVGGIKADLIERALKGTGFEAYKVIAHSDGVDLRQPHRGRLPRKVLEWALLCAGVTEYAHRAKNISVVARKSGALSY